MNWQQEPECKDDCGYRVFWYRRDVFYLILLFKLQKSTKLKVWKTPINIRKMRSHPEPLFIQLNIVHTTLFECFSSISGTKMWVAADDSPAVIAMKSLWSCFFLGGEGAVSLHVCTYDSLGDVTTWVLLLLYSVLVCVVVHVSTTSITGY